MTKLMKPSEALVYMAKKIERELATPDKNISIFCGLCWQTALLVSQRKISMSTRAAIRARIKELLGSENSFLQTWLERQGYAQKITQKDWKKLANTRRLWALDMAKYFESVGQ